MTSKAPVLTEELPFLVKDGRRQVEQFDAVTARLRELEQNGWKLESVLAGTKARESLGKRFNGVLVKAGRELAPENIALRLVAVGVRRS